MPRKKVEVSDLQLRVIEDMAGRGAVLDDIAYVIGIPPATLDRIKARDERVELAYRRGRAIATDNMATRLWAIARCAAAAFAQRCGERKPQALSSVGRSRCGT